MVVLSMSEYLDSEGYVCPSMCLSLTEVLTESWRAG